jgi:branched-chain amino acid transport system substrate-binding protein
MASKRCLTIGLLALLLLSGCTAPSQGQPAAAKPAPAAGQSSGGTYTFGVLIPLTGAAASIGTVFRNGLDMAVEEINRQGGAAGMTLEANVQDHKASAQGGVAAMNQLVNIVRVPYVISSFSSPSLASQPIAEQNKVLLVNSGGTDLSLLNKPYLYNNQVMSHNLVPPLARFAWDDGHRRAAMISNNDAYGDGNRKVFREVWQTLGGEIVADEVFPLESTDFSAQLAKTKAANPDFVLVTAFGQTHGLVVKQARALGLDAQLAGPLATNDLVQQGGPAAEGFWDNGIAVDPDTTNPGARQFIDNYRQKYGVVPDWSSGTMYEAVYLLRDLIEAVAREGGDPRSGEALLKALQRKPEFQNFLAAGTVRFGDDQSVIRTLAIRRVVAGQFQPIKFVEAN